MKDIIKIYFDTMMQDGFDLDAAYDNLIEMIDEIKAEIEEKK